MDEGLPQNQGVVGGPSGNLLSSASPMEPLSGVSTKGFDQAQGCGA